MGFGSRRRAALCAVMLAAPFPSLLHAETRVVRAGDNLQAALNAAVPGDVIVLDAGAQFVGNFVLPAKSGDTPIVLRSAFSSELPPDRERIRTDHAPRLARIRSSNTGAALRTAAAAHHWELRYLEFAANHDGYGDILQIGDGSAAQKTLASVPHHIVLSHLYIHGDRLVGQKRCVALNAAHVTIRDSYIADCKGVGMDTQAIGGWNGPGPYTIENNYLEGAGENVLFGGADPAIPGLVADGIVVRDNLISRPFAWRDPIISTPQAVTAAGESGGLLPAGTYAYRIVARRPVGQGTVGRSTASVEAVAAVGAGGAVRVTWDAVPDATDYLVYGRTAASQLMFWTVTTPSFVDTGAGGELGAVPTTSGTVWSVKNLFELKNARNVLVEGNILQNHWQQAQAGYAIVLTPRNSGGTCTWCVVEGVTFEYNIVRNSTAGINITGYDVPSRPTQQSRDLVFRGNLFYNIGEGLFMLIGDGPQNVLVDHNTISHMGNAVVYVYGGTSADPWEVYGVRITNNAARHSTYGINGAFFGYGNPVINAFFPGSTITANFLAGGLASRYPAGNRTAGSFDAEFVNAAGGDFRLQPGSQLRGTASDGGDIGAAIGSLLTRLRGVEAGMQVPVVKRPTNVRIISLP